MNIDDRMDEQEFHAHAKIVQLPVDTIPWIYMIRKLVVKTEKIEWVMQLGFVNLAKKVLLTWISKLTKDESH